MSYGKKKFSALCMDSQLHALHMPLGMYMHKVCLMHV